MYNFFSLIHMWFLSSWSFLEITTSSKYNDSIQAYAAGAVEAAVTSQVSFSFHHTSFTKKSKRLIYTLDIANNLKCKHVYVLAHL